MKVIAGALGAGIVLAGTFGGPTANASPYKFTLIAETGSEFALLDTHAIINNLGQVAFTAGLPSPGNNQFAIYVGDGKGHTLIADTLGSFAFGNGQSFTGVGLGDLNDSGVVALSASHGSTTGIFVGSGGPLTPIYDPTVPQNTNIASVGSPTINASGHVAFHGVQSPSVVIVRNMGSGNVILDGSHDGNGPDFFSLSGPEILDNDTVVYQGIGQSGQGNGVFANGGASPIFPDIVAASINNNLDVAWFESTVNQCTTGVQTLRAVIGGVPTVFVDGCDTDYTGSIQDASLNDLGKIVFRGEIKAPDQHPLSVGVYTGPDRVKHKVIESGDPLFGSSVIDIALGSGLTLTDDVALNNRGQIAFFAELADGRRVIARANVSSSSTLVLATVGLVAMVGLRTLRASSPRTRVRTQSAG